MLVGESADAVIELAASSLADARSSALISALAPFGEAVARVERPPSAALLWGAEKLAFVSKKVDQ
jgi:hypothetical protein